jgi:hypothetical protein
MADLSGAASHPAVAALLAVTPLDPNRAFGGGDWIDSPERAAIAARQAAAVLRWLVERRSEWTDYTAWELDDLTDLADEIDPKEGE